MSRLFEGYNEDVIPFAPAAGAINGNSKEEIVTKVRDVARSLAAAVTWGSITRNGGLGNAIEYGGRVFYHNPKAGVKDFTSRLPVVFVI